MRSKTLVALAAASLVGQAIAGPHQQHGLRHAHQKRALVTERVTVTDWVTVTVMEGETTSTAAKVFYTQSHKSRPQPSSESTTSSAAAPPAPSPIVPTTIVTQVTSTSSVPEQNNPPAAEAAPSSSSAPEVVDTPPPPSSSAPEIVNTPPPPPPAPSSTAPPVPAPAPVQEGNGSGSSGSGGDTGGNTGGGAKRGLSYNNPQLLKSLLSSGTKVSWTYNWGQYDDSATDLEFCPMLWGLKLDFAQTWPNNAQKAIDAGSKCLFSFNEPDLREQADMPAQLAAEKHIELMNPFSGKALIGSPAITNGGGDNQGIQYLQKWFDACGGKCAVDFVNIHIYGVDTNTFLAHLLKVNSQFNKPVWITEFAFDGSEAEINSQLKTVIDQIETNATYSFVQRYSYFMVQDGTMVKGNAPSAYGNTFAYGA
ncbi:glycosyl hydrolase catalytic core-domain-containing protein [Chaetomidium leptoderma]|uniref:Glycosyl hydrolase catalytic core-domain-containing protein n=1 Tax=Chaetomidium leptoderma TaxID=669021 RepID=A0AAN7A076_9PEZI|nr:glycosyl hydrolase catalytic core-domain-containing protein [Chaetomidium leptoderma]